MLWKTCLPIWVFIVLDLYILLWVWNFFQNKIKIILFFFFKELALIDYLGEDKQETRSGDCP